VTDPDATTPTPRPEPPPATRLWLAVQRVGRLRDEYTRAKTPADRLAAARAMAARVGDLPGLAAEVLAEAERQAAGLPEMEVDRVPVTGPG